LKDEELEHKLYERIDSYLKQVFELYDTSSFGGKVKILKLLSLVYQKTMLSNNKRLRDRLSMFVQSLKQKEEQPNGNHYLSLYLTAVFKEGDRIVTDELAQAYVEKLQSLEQDVDEYFDHEFFLRKSVREDFKQQAGFDLDVVNFREQYGFFEYTKDYTNTDMERVFSFLKDYKSAGFRTFLSLEQGGRDMGDKILALGEKLPKKPAELLFAKYGVLADTALKAEETLQSLLPENMYEASRTRLQSIKESLLKRAKELLVKFWESDEFNEVDMLKALDRYNKEILLFAETYKSFAESGEPISLEDMLATQIKTLSMEERQEKADLLWEINKVNRKAFIVDPTEMNKREERFRHTMLDDNVSFYVLEHKGNVVAFCSFELLPDGSLLVESLNVEEEIKSTKVGGDFFKVLVADLGRKHTIVGYVHHGNAGTLPYYERIGFHVSEEEKDGKPVYKITYPKAAIDE
jgi:N-acetylglutamate synthase-like GNAT family acetyltransferase